MNYTLFFLCFSLDIIPGVLQVGELLIVKTIKEKYDTVKIDEIQKFRIKEFILQKKAMHDLEYASLVLDIVLGFVCVNLSLLYYLYAGKDFERKTGLIGLIT